MSIVREREPEIAHQPEERQIQVSTRKLAVDPVQVPTIQQPVSLSRIKHHSRHGQLLSHNWGFVAFALLTLIFSLIVGMVFSLHLLTPSTSSPQAPLGNTSNANTTSAQTSTLTHQLYDAQAPAALQGSTVDITLTVKEILVSIAPNVTYNAWTFNGTVPGPVLRVRQGQTIHFTLENEGLMPHSIDFHAAQTPWNINYQAVPAGKSFSFDWKANYPGVFMYHCGAPTAIYHMANGMYGMIIVDPEQGWAPAQEYTLVQSEFYTAKLANGTYTVDPEKLNAGQPDYVVFNGYTDQYQNSPIVVHAGQRIRLFLVNAGPTLFSAFHVIGAIFSDTYIDGNPANHMVGDQTVTIPPGGGVVVELTIPEPGLYPFVTHSFASVGKGALGMLKVIP